MESSNFLFCPINSLKPKDIQFTITYDKEKAEILIIKNAVVNERECNNKCGLHISTKEYHENIETFPF